MARPCPPSADSVSVIDSCPMTSSEWNQRALLKNCSMYPQTCTKPLEYHCLLNPYANESLEVCAPDTWLAEDFCPSYNINQQRILEQFNCTSLISDCPKRQYFSRSILHYKGCLKELHGSTTFTPSTANVDRFMTSLTQSTFSKVENYTSATTPDTTMNHNDQSMDILVPIIISVLIALIVVIAVIALVCCWRKRLICFNGSQQDIELQRQDQNNANINASPENRPLLTGSNEETQSDNREDQNTAHGTRLSSDQNNANITASPENRPLLSGSNEETQADNIEDQNTAHGTSLSSVRDWVDPKDSTVTADKHTDSKTPKQTVDNIETETDNKMDVIQNLLVEEAASQDEVVNRILGKLTNSIKKVVGREGMSFVEYQSNMVILAKSILMTIDKMIGMIGTRVNSSDLDRLASQLTREYDMFASNSANAAATSNSKDIANRIRTTVQDMGNSCVKLVQNVCNNLGDPNAMHACPDLQHHVSSVRVNVSSVLVALQSGSRGTQACINAARAVRGIIADLDTTIMFATVGALCTQGDDNFASHKKDILTTANALEEESKVIQGAAFDPETLAGAAQQAIKTMTELADLVKLGAASLGSDQPEAQVEIMNAVKNVACALIKLINATKNASVKNVSDQEVLTLKEYAKVMEKNVSLLLSTTKRVEDEATRGMRALEFTIEAIGQEIKV